MGWEVFGEQLETSDLDGSSQRVFHSLTPTTENAIVIAARAWLIVYNNPTFTNISMQIWSNNAQGNVPKQLIATSTNVVLKADLHQLANAVRECYFEFDNVPLQKNDLYHFVLRGTSYVGSDSSHLAWRKAYPDPVYSYGTTPAFVDMLKSPYALYLIGAEF